MGCIGIIEAEAGVVDIEMIAMEPGVVFSSSVAVIRLKGVDIGLLTGSIFRGLPLGILFKSSDEEFELDRENVVQTGERGRRDGWVKFVSFS